MIRCSQLRAQAIAHTLFPETTLARAVAQLGFVQADPIRAPARAQDLILRQAPTQRQDQIRSRSIRLSVTPKAAARMHLA